MNMPDRHKRFDGFEQFYDKTLQPYLLAKEQERKQKYKRAKSAALMTALGGAALAGLAFAFSNNPLLGLVILGFGVIGAFAVRAKMMEAIRRDTKKFIMTKVCEYLGWQYHLTPEEEPDLHLWYRNGLLPRWDRVKFEDEIIGQHKGADFRLCDAHLEKEDTDGEGNRKWVTTFRGLLFHIQVPKPFYGKTVVLRDAGLFNRKKRAGMKRVGLVSGTFEKIFEAYGTDQVEARTFLTPDFMQKMIDLEMATEGKKLRFGFIDGQLLVAIQTGDQFEPGSMSTPLTDRSRIDKTLSELSLVMGIIEAMNPAQSARRS